MSKLKLELAFNFSHTNLVYQCILVCASLLTGPLLLLYLRSYVLPLLCIHMWFYMFCNQKDKHRGRDAPATGEVRQ